MKLDKGLVLKRPKDLVVDCVLKKEDNKYKEDVYLLYNPDGYGGIMSVGKQMADLINLFDGNKSIASALMEAGISSEDTEIAMSILGMLVEKQFLKYEGFTFEAPPWKRELTCWLHITNDCNLRCRYCYIHKSHSIMPDDIMFSSIDKMIESCKKNNYEGLTIMMTGGEALTRFDKVKEIVSYCKEKADGLRIRYNIPSNGTLITPEVAQYIADNQISVGVSIDGVKEYHDINRVRVDGSGSFDKAMEGIENLRKCHIIPSVLVTVTEENLDGLPEFTKLMIDKGMYFRFSFERDTQTGKPAILNDVDHCVEVLYKCFNIMEEALKEGNVNWKFKFGDVNFERPKRRSCAAGKNFFAIGQDGSIGSCSIGLENPKSNIKALNDVIPDTQELFAEIGTTSACDIPECKECVWRHSCAGACPLQTYASYKTYLHVSPHCALYKACLPEVVRIYAMATYFINRKGG